VRTNKQADKKQTDKQTPLKTPTSLRYARPVGNKENTKYRKDRDKT